MISESTIERIKAAGRMEDFCTATAKAYGQNKLFCECPACKYRNDKKKQGLVIDQKSNTAKCFNCGQFYGNPIDFIMQTTGSKYPEALQFAAKQYGIFIEEVTERVAVEGKPRRKGNGSTGSPTKTPKPPKAAPVPERETVEGKPATRNPKTTAETTISDTVPEHVEGGPSGLKSFCDLQLEESGLCYSDLRIETSEADGTRRGVSPFVQGTRDQFGSYLEQKGDDVLIRYYDLDAKPVTYPQPRTGRLLPLVRVRWQNPAAHPDQHGNPIKYQSPAGSGSHVYIPEKLRQMYKYARQFERLYIQEGEKKAEKCSKHGLMSVGIMGINNLASDKRLPEEIQLIIQRCGVKEVIFVLDSDFMNLSETLINGQPVDSRPLQFFAAVRSFKEYLRTLANLGCPVEIYFAYVRPNETKSKGIDDLFVSFPELAEGLTADFDFAINDKRGQGKFIQVNKITMLPDDKIADFWLLNDAEAFAKHHKKRLEGLKEFKIRGILRCFDESGALVMAQQLFKDEQFWDEQFTESRSGDMKKQLYFDYVNAMNFLQRRGFFRYEMQSGDKVLIRIENRIITAIDHTIVKDFTKSFCREIKRLDVLNMLMKGGPQYLGPEKLSNLDLNRPPIERAAPDKQCLFFKDKIWEITAEGIKELNYGQFTAFVWSEKIIPHKVTALPTMVEAQPITAEMRPDLKPIFDDIPDGEFFVDYSPEAGKSHFLSFLQNTSNFSHRKPDEQINLDDQFLAARHLVNKLTAIGYLLHDYKDDNESKAVIAMDGKLSEVGASNGRSGKSLVGVALSNVMPQVTVDGKQKDIDDDKFRYHEVTEKTKNLFFDDVRANFDFESLFQVITGKMTVNQKSGLRFTLRREQTPKILITTNHAINGLGSSFDDRQAFMVFSDFYNDNHKPVDDFGMTFFSEWDADQWNYFFNLMANCLVLYFRSKQNRWAASRGGIVPPPMEDVARRKLRQIMGENFLTWADAYFFWDSKTKNGNLNTQLYRKDLFDDFLNENPAERKWCKPARFKDMIVAFCNYNGYNLNPSQRNKEGRDIVEFKKAHPERPFIGEPYKSNGKEYFTLSNDEFSNDFQ